MVDGCFVLFNGTVKGLFIDPFATTTANFGGTFCSSTATLLVGSASSASIKLASFAMAFRYSFALFSRFSTAFPRFSSVFMDFYDFNGSFLGASADGLASGDGKTA